MLDSTATRGRAKERNTLQPGMIVNDGSHEESRLRLGGPCLQTCGYLYYSIIEADNLNNSRKNFSRPSHGIKGDMYHPRLNRVTIRYSNGLKISIVRPCLRRSITLSSECESG